MSKTAMIRARTELKLKSKVEKIFEALGLTASQAINLFYHRVELENGLPFELRIPNSKTLRTLPSGAARPLRCAPMRLAMPAIAGRSYSESLSPS